MRGAGRAAVGLVLVGGLLAPAWAGTEQDPEVQGECSGGGVRVAGDHVVCQAWFDAATTSGTTVLTTTVRVAGDLEARRLPTRVQLGWSRDDGCRESWSVDDVLGSGVEVPLRRACPGGEQAEVALDPSRARTVGSTLELALTGADLRQLGSDLAPGDALRRPTASSAVLLRAPGGRTGEAVTGRDTTPAGRDYVLPPAGG